MSNKSVLGIIGGSGVYDIDGLTNTRWEKMNPRLVNLQMNYYLGELDGQKMVFCQDTVVDIEFLHRKLILKRILMP